MELIKNVGYGIVAKSVKLQVFLSPEKYIEAVNEAKSYNIAARTDSELINRILDIFIKQLPIKTLENERMKSAIADKNKTIMDLQQELNDFKLSKAKK